MPPRLSQEIPGPPICSFCGSTSSDRYVGGYGNNICRECIEHPQLSDTLPADAVCALCHRELTGGTDPARAIVACRQGLVLCDDCLRIAREVLAEVSAPPH